MEEAIEGHQTQQHEEREEDDDNGENNPSKAAETNEVLTPSFPLARVRKIVKLDPEIKKVNSEALLLIALAADLFLSSLADRARDAALQKKRRVIKLDHLRSAVRSHPPTSDFLLDCLPNPSQGPSAAARPRPAATTDKPLPPGARRIDQFFSKPAAESQ